MWWDGITMAWGKNLYETEVIKPAGSDSERQEFSFTAEKPIQQEGIVMRYWGWPVQSWIGGSCWSQCLVSGALRTLEFPPRLRQSARKLFQSKQHKKMHCRFWLKATQLPGHSFLASFLYKFMRTSTKYSIWWSLSKDKGKNSTIVSLSQTQNLMNSQDHHKGNRRRDVLVGKSDLDINAVHLWVKAFLCVKVY